MALMREAEVWAEGGASSGGYSGVGEVRRSGGADGSRNEELGIWKTEEEENSGNDSTCGEKMEGGWGGGGDEGQEELSVPKTTGPLGPVLTRVGYRFNLNDYDSVSLF